MTIIRKVLKFKTSKEFSESQIKNLLKSTMKHEFPEIYFKKIDKYHFKNNPKVNTLGHLIFGIDNLKSCYLLERNNDNNYTVLINSTKLGKLSNNFVEVISAMKGIVQSAEFLIKNKTFEELEILEQTNKNKYIYFEKK